MVKALNMNAEKAIETTISPKMESSTLRKCLEYLSRNGISVSTQIMFFLLQWIPSSYLEKDKFKDTKWGGLCQT